MSLNKSTVPTHLMRVEPIESCFIARACALRYAVSALRLRRPSPGGFTFNC